MARAAVIVLDGVGIGEAPDASSYGDEGSDTLGNLAREVEGFELPFLESLGLGCCRPLAGMSCGEPLAAFGTARPRSKGKDSTSGHWEICELLIDEPFPTYPDGFPDCILKAFSAATGREVIGNKAVSGTAIIQELGARHMTTGSWIVYTSADSVFQVAAHEAVVPLEELYGACREARRILTGPDSVSRVIARPFTGEEGNFIRTPNRRDFSVQPPGDTLLDRLKNAGIERIGVGKVDDLFAGRAIESRHTRTNAEAYDLIEQQLEFLDSGFVFANVIEFDQSWGHRNDVQGFYNGLRELDKRLPRILDLLRQDDLMIITADHGNDPTTGSTDHSREVVPVLALGPGRRSRDLGQRETFADLGATVAEFFGLEAAAGRSFLSELTR